MSSWKIRFIQDEPVTLLSDLILTCSDVTQTWAKKTSQDDGGCGFFVPGAAASLHWLQQHRA